MINLLFAPSGHPLIDDREPGEIGVPSFKQMNKSSAKPTQRIHTDAANLHNKNFNFKRLMPHSYVTFCLLNMHHLGFGELNPLYECQVIEKYILVPSAA